MGRYGSWHDQVDAGTKADMHDAFVAEMELSSCRECNGVGKVPDPLADCDYGSWFVPCPSCATATQVAEAA